VNASCRNATKWAGEGIERKVNQISTAAAAIDDYPDRFAHTAHKLHEDLAA